MQQIIADAAIAEKHVGASSVDTAFKVDEETRNPGIVSTDQSQSVIATGTGPASGSDSCDSVVTFPTSREAAIASQFDCDIDGRFKKTADDHEDTAKPFESVFDTTDREPEGK